LRRLRLIRHAPFCWPPPTWRSATRFGVWTQPRRSAKTQYPGCPPT